MIAKNLLNYDHVVEFHGHSCIGSALGYRVALKAMDWLKSHRAEDEEIVCVVENDSCAVDAIQAITGCTFGKGNLIFRDIGKRGYTFYNRNTNEGVRILENYRPAESDEMAELRKAVFGGGATEEQLKQFRELSKTRIDDILNAKDEELIEIKEITSQPPPRARLFGTLTCSSCGEKVMEPRAVITDQGALCADCSDKSD